MTTYVLIPGAGGDARYWQFVEPYLTAAGADVIAVDLPADDDSAGLTEYTDRVCDAAADVAGPVILVAQSLGGFTAPLVAERRRVDLIVLVNAMVPSPVRPVRSGGPTPASGRHRRHIARE